MPTYSQIQFERGKGLSFQEIGQLFGISKQRAHAIFTGYMKQYKQTTTFKEYKRHYDNAHTRAIIICTYCIKEQK